MDDLLDLLAFDEDEDEGNSANKGGKGSSSDEDVKTPVLSPDERCGHRLACLR
jgi:hypothetical protein